SATLLFLSPGYESRQQPDRDRRTDTRCKCPNELGNCLGRRVGTESCRRCDGTCKITRQTRALPGLLSQLRKRAQPTGSCPKVEGQHRTSVLNPPSAGKRSETRDPEAEGEAVVNWIYDLRFTRRRARPAIKADFKRWLAEKAADTALDYDLK